MQMRRDIELIKPDFSQTWLEPISHDNCYTRNQYIWVTCGNWLIEIKQTELPNVYREFKDSQKLFYDISGKWDGGDETEEHLQAEKDYQEKQEKLDLLLDNLELLNKVKLENIVPDISNDNETVDKTNALFKEHGILFRLNSNIIQTDYSLNYTRQEMYMKPSDEELSLVKSREVVQLDEKDKERIKADQSDNASFLSLTNPRVKSLVIGKIKTQKNREVDLYVRKPNSQDNRFSSSSQTIRPASSSQTSALGPSRNQNHRLGQNPVNRPESRPSTLAIDSKPWNDKGKRSYSTKSLNQNYVKSAGSN